MDDGRAGDGEKVHKELEKGWGKWDGNLYEALLSITATSVDGGSKVKSHDAVVDKKLDVKVTNSVGVGRKSCGCQGH